MSDAPSEGDENRLRKLRRVHAHRGDVSPTDEPESFFLLRLLDARDAALREANAKIKKLELWKAEIIPGVAHLRNEYDRLQPVIAAARDLWRVGAPLRDKLPALAAALDVLDAQPQPRE